MANNSVDIVLRFSSLGDIVLCSGFMEKLKSQSQSRIIFGTLQPFREMLGTFYSAPHDSWGLPKSSLAIFFRTFTLLKAEHSQRPLKSIRVFDLHGVPKSFFFKLATLLFCLQNRIVYRSYKSSKKSFRRWLILVLKKDILGKRHVFAEHQKLLEPASQIFFPRLRNHKSAESARVLIAPDSQHWKKKWPATFWEEFFRLACTALPDAEFTLVGAPGIFPQDMLDQLADTFGDRFKNRLGQLPLSDLGRIASEHQLTLCGNSAWQHISEAVGVPVVSLPGPIVKGFGFSPFLLQSRELEVNLSCRPCTRHGGGLCHRTGDDFHACMRQITPEMLLKNAQELLRS